MASGSPLVPRPDRVPLHGAHSRITDAVRRTPAGFRIVQGDDVALVPPVDGDSLVYLAATGLWTPQAASGVRPSTWVIAASDSRNQNADFVCPGTQDDVAISNFLPSTSGIGVTFLEGHYAMDGGQLLDFAGSWVRGQGFGSTFFNTNGSDQGVFAGGEMVLTDLQVIGASTAGGSIAPVLSDGKSRFDRLLVSNSGDGAAYRVSNADIFTACVANAPSGTGFESGNSSTFLGCDVPRALVGFDSLEGSRLIGCALGRYSDAVSSPAQLGTAFTGVDNNLVVGCAIDAADLDDVASSACDYLSNLLAGLAGATNVAGSNSRFAANVLGTLTDTGSGNVYSFTGGAVGDNF